MRKALETHEYTLQNYNQSKSEWHTHREAEAGVTEAAFAEGAAAVGIAVA